MASNPARVQNCGIGMEGKMHLTIIAFLAAHNEEVCDGRDSGGGVCQLTSPLSHCWSHAVWLHVTLADGPRRIVCHKAGPKRRKSSEDRHR